MSSNIESTVAPARAAPVQRKKKTVPVITKYEEFTYETPNVVSTGIPQSPEVAQTGQQSMAETLLTIIQTKPVIQTPKYKKKNVTVADVVAPKIPKQNKKKNVEPAPEPGIVESNIENIESLTVVEQVIAETPKVPKKRAPKKKVETVAPEQTVIPEQTVVYESNIGNIESPIEEAVVPENTLEVVPAKAPKKRAPKKKVEPVVVVPEQTGIVESNIENIESLFGNMTLEEVPVEAPKAPKKRAPKKKPVAVEVAEVVIAEQTVVIESNIENIESPMETVPENTLEVVPIEAPKAPRKRVPKKKPVAVEVAEVVIAEQTVVIESNIENIESPMETVVPAKAPKKRAPKKKVETVAPEQTGIAEQTGIVESNIENIESLFGNMTLEEVPVEAPKAPKKRVSKKKTEVVIAEQTGIVESKIENIESPIETVPENTLEVVPVEVPKAPKKRVTKKKTEVVIAEQTGIIESKIENIESPIETVPENTLEVVPVEVPKAPKKRVTKKKTEVVIAEQTGIIESKIENIESPMESVVQENTLEINKEDNGMEWFDEQAKEVQIRREPILATFAEPCQELVEEIYEATTNQNNPIEKEDSTPYGNLQPIADIIADTLEYDEDDYSEQIMVETFEFNGQTYWIDEENRVLDKNTFQHIGQYDDSIAAISFYANAI